VFHFNANLNRTKDWSWPSDATPKSMSYWMVMGAADSVSKPQMWVPEEKVADGWYNLQVGVGVGVEGQGGGLGLGSGRTTLAKPSQWLPAKSRFCVDCMMRSSLMLYT
jgi:hypothetical protein